MPVLYSKFLKPQNVPLFIKGLLPSRTNFIILFGVSVGLAVTITCILTRRKERLFRGLAAAAAAAASNERWKNPEDNEKPRRRARTGSSTSLLQPSPLWPKTSSISTTPTTTTTTVTNTNTTPTPNRVNFKIDPAEEEARTITSMSEIPQQAENLELQRRRSYPNRDTSEMNETNEEIVVAEGWRRHTRVYGGGVCQACLESEERMRAMNIKLQSNPAQEPSPNQSGGGNIVKQDSEQQQQQQQQSN